MVDVGPRDGSDMLRQTPRQVRAGVAASSVEEVVGFDGDSVSREPADSARRALGTAPMQARATVSESSHADQRNDMEIAPGSRTTGVVVDLMKFVRTIPISPIPGPTHDDWLPTF